MPTDWAVALQLTLVALGALIIISIFFILLTRILGWIARITGQQDVEEEKDLKKVAIATAAVMSYLEERPASIRVVKGEKGAVSRWRAQVDNRFHEVIGWRGKKGDSGLPSRERPTRWRLRR